MSTEIAISEVGRMMSRARQEGYEQGFERGMTQKCINDVICAIDGLEDEMRAKDAMLVKPKRTTAIADIVSLRNRLQIEAENNGYTMPQPSFFKRLLRLVKRALPNVPHCVTREDMRTIGVGISECAVFVLFLTAVVGAITMISVALGGGA